MNCVPQNSCVEDLTLQSLECNYLRIRTFIDSEVNRRSLRWAPVQRDLYPHTKRLGHSQEVEARPCEDTGRKEPPTIQGGRPQNELG